MVSFQFDEANRISFGCSQGTDGKFEEENRICRWSRCGVYFGCVSDIVLSLLPDTDTIERIGSNSLIPVAIYS